MAFLNLNKQQCFVATHSATLDVRQKCDGTTKVYFEDFTDNHNKAIIRVNREANPNCSFTLIIETDERIIERSIERDPGSDFERAFQVENLRKISVRCNVAQGNPNCRGTIEIDKTFCICCEDNKDDSDHDCCCDHKDSKGHDCCCDHKDSKGHHEGRPSKHETLLQLLQQLSNKSV